MNEKAPTKVKARNPDVFSALLFASFKAILINAAAWFVLVIWFMGEAFAKGQRMALQHAQSIVQINVHFLEQSPSFLAHHLNQWFYQAHQSLNTLLGQSSLLQNQLVHNSLSLLMIATEIDLLRLFIFILALPLFVVTLFVFITDGLVKRDIRKFKGARESTFVFHRSKYLIGFCFFIPFFIYVSMPVVLSPVIFLTIQMLLIGFIARLSVTYFKKYL